MTVLIPKKKELITLFDQHAVDERVKLEKLMNGNHQSKKLRKNLII